MLKLPGKSLAEETVNSIRVTPGLNVHQPAQGRNSEITFPSGGSEADSLLNSATVKGMLNSGLNPGETVTIHDGRGETLLQIHRQGTDRFDAIGNAAKDLFHSAAAGISNIVAQDPSFAFKEAALAVQTQVFAGMPGNLTAIAAKGFLPMIRVVSLALDLKKTIDTWKAHEGTRLDKAVDSLHLATDVVGLGGAIGMIAPVVGPSVALGMTAVGLMGDVGAYGYHMVKYFRDRGLPVPPPDPPPPSPTPDPTPSGGGAPVPVPAPPPVSVPAPPGGGASPRPGGGPNP